MSGTKWFDPGFPHPFTRNGCVPLAWTALQDAGNRSVAFAHGLAIIAKRTRTTKGYGGGGYLLTDANSSHCTQARIFDWARIAGLKIVEMFEPKVTYECGKPRERWSPRLGDFITVHPVRRVGQPTVAQFLRGKGRRGRWFILTNGHAQASINGRPKGQVSKRDRVHFAVRIEA